MVDDYLCLACGRVSSIYDDGTSKNPKQPRAPRCTCGHKLSLVKKAQDKSAFSIAIVLRHYLPEIRKIQQPRRELEVEYGMNADQERKLKACTRQIAEADAKEEKRLRELIGTLRKLKQTGMVEDAAE